MSLSMSQNYTAISPNLTASFLAAGGTSPYVYSVVSGGAGGSINSSTGLYTAPASANSNPNRLYDVVQVTDASNNSATGSILIGTPLLLFCEVIQNQMGLDNGRVYLWDQKLFQPTDYDLYIAVSVMTCRPFGNTVEYDGSGSGLNAIQNVNMWASVDMDIISRGPAARDQKELVIAALNSVYAQAQQEYNSFYIGKISTNFINLSHIDGAAIPYRFRISCALQYTVSKTVPIAYFNTFSNQTLVNS